MNDKSIDYPCQDNPFGFKSVSRFSPADYKINLQDP